MRRADCSSISRVTVQSASCCGGAERLGAAEPLEYGRRYVRARAVDAEPCLRAAVLPLARRLAVRRVRAGSGNDAGPNRDSWVAVSRPPWFTALALWFVGGTFCTGGYFPDAGKFWLGFEPDHRTKKRCRRG